MQANSKRILIIIMCALFIALSIGVVLMTLGGDTEHKRGDTEHKRDGSVTQATLPEPQNSGIVTEDSTAQTSPIGVPDNIVSRPEQEDENPPAASAQPSDTYVDDDGDSDNNTYADDEAGNTSDPESSDDDEAQQPDFAEPVIDNSETGTARICIGGDTSIDSEFADAANKWGVDYPWKEVTEVFSGADLAIVNLETCVSERGTSEKREGYGFRTPPEMLEGFVNAGIDMVNLANNHTRDFGYDALTDTFEYLSNYGIDYFGAGINKEQAEGLVIKTVNGVKIGFAGCNYVYLTNDCAAAEDHAGINMVYKMSDERTAAFLEKIKEYDTQCDVLIVFMHAGTEEVFEVNSYQKKLAHALVDSGVDIVVGAHPHTLQPIEFYNGKPIFYSIGNLIFWHIDDDIDGLTCIFDITVDKDGFKSLKLHPLFIKSYKVFYLERDAGKYSSRYEQIIDLMNKLCKPNGIEFDDEGNMVKSAG